MTPSRNEIALAGTLIMPYKERACRQGEAPIAQQAQHSKKAAAKGSAVNRNGEQPAAPEERHRMIAEAAYLIAEGHNFQSERHWLQVEVDTQRDRTGDIGECYE